MRLTLRTLLAYLDNTLDPQDAEILRQKLGESGFATQLVQRIRNTLANQQLAAPSPEAVGPVEEANVISEYLDSTLPAEQVAEIERACLESDPHLAEAAACHQILTMVLGRKAEVSAELRQRIYDLPETDVEAMAASGSFSSVSIPPETPIGSAQDVIPTEDSGSVVANNQPVEPVGKGDSGVSDAPTRIRQSDPSVEAVPTTASTVSSMAGSRARLGDEQTKIYGGQIRTSRITPWLVSLALAGVLLFALARIFAPLLTVDQVSSNETGSPPATTESESRAGSTGRPGNTRPAEVPVGSEDALDGSTRQPGRQSRASDPPKSDDADSNAAKQERAGTGGGRESSSIAEVTELIPPGVAKQETDLESPPVETLAPPMALPAPDPSLPDASAEPGPSVTVTPRPTAEPPEMAPIEPGFVENVGPDASSDSVELPAGNPAVAVEPGEPKLEVERGTGTEEATAEMPSVDAPADPGGDVPAPDPSAAELATVVSSDALMFAQVGRDDAARWVRLQEGTSIVEGVPILCAPTFRGKVSSIANVEVTLVGPARIRWTMEDDAVTLHLDYGRVLLVGTEPEVTFNMMLAEQPVQLELLDVDAVFAASVQFVRPPGVDPLVDGNRLPVTGVLSVEGMTKVISVDREETLVAGQRWIKRGDAEPQISTIESVPEWIDPADPNASTLEASARKGLLALLDGVDSLELSLREATGFRQTEVAALAARTLLLMGQPDVYFGGDGILSESKQRTYWSEHFNALMDAVDLNAESAADVQRSVENMDSANAAAIMKLLTGYSQKQLKAGGDAQLVELLDSPSMSVRVLALENLRRITGTTLYFRAEQDNAIRREPGIKKWEVRQRKGDIRWPE